MSRTPITIRTAALKDLPALVALSQASSQAAHWSPVQWNDIFHTEIPARHAWISQSPEGPCGFLVAASGVAAANLAARALYTASGFQLLARRTGYYEAPAEDALILVHMLDHAL